MIVLQVLLIPSASDMLDGTRNVDGLLDHAENAFEYGKSNATVDAISLRIMRNVRQNVTQSNRQDMLSSMDR